MELEQYERRNNDSREQYDILCNCIECKSDYSCEYSNKAYSKDNVCGWYKTILNDIEKIKTGGLLTFPILPKIIKDKEKKNKIENLEKKLINNKPELNSINILIDSIFITKKYKATNGDYNKVIEWQERNKKDYMRRYDLNNDEVIYNVNLIRDYKLK